MNKDLSAIDRDIRRLLEISEQILKDKEIDKEIDEEIRTELKELDKKISNFFFNNNNEN